MKNVVLVVSDCGREMLLTTDWLCRSFPPSAVPGLQRIEASETFFFKDRPSCQQLPGTDTSLLTPYPTVHLEKLLVLSTLLPLGKADYSFLTTSPVLPFYFSLVLLSRGG